MKWTSCKSGLYLPEKEIVRAYRDEDYERWINIRRAPFQPPFVREPLQAAITRVQKTTSFSATNASSYNTASVTATANRLYIAGILTYDGTGLTTSISGAGLGTWVSIGTQIVSPTGERISIFRAMSASPGAGAAIAIAAGGTVTACAWDIQEFDGVDTTGTNGSGAIGSENTNTSTGASCTVTLASVAGNSAVYAAFSCDSSTTATPSSGYSSVSHQANSTDGVTFEATYLNPGTTTPGITFGASNISAKAIEIKIGGAPALPPYIGAITRNLAFVYGGGVTGGRQQ